MTRGSDQTGERTISENSMASLLTWFRGATGDLAVAADEFHPWFVGLTHGALRMNSAARIGIRATDGADLA